MDEKLGELWTQVRFHPDVVAGQIVTRETIRIELEGFNIGEDWDDDEWDKVIDQFRGELNSFAWDNIYDDIKLLIMDGVIKLPQGS